MKLYIIRHGETSWNRERRLQGRSDIALNENGRALARATAEGMKDIPFDLAFTSPLVRAKETAGLILEGRNVPIVEDERIIEISFGAYEGTHWTEEDITAACPKEGDALSLSAAERADAARWRAAYEITNFFYHPERYAPPENGETLLELAARTSDFLQDICSRPDLEEKTILISTHGAASRALLNSLRTYEMSDFWHTGVAKNCGVAIVESRGGVPALLRENVTYY